MDSSTRTRTNIVSPHGGKTVIIVEDDEAARDSMAVLLQGRGYAVETHASATSLLDGIKDFVGACMILDGTVGGVTCFEILDMLRQRGVILPTVLFTSLSDATLAAHLAAHDEIVTVLRKPLGGEVLVSAVCQALGIG